MADKEAQQKKVESTVEEVEKDKSEETTAPVEEDSRSENGDNEENGDNAEKENGTEAEEKPADDETDKVCNIKRKSTGGDISNDAPAEGATPEKKLKLADAAEAESNGEAEVVA